MENTKLYLTIIKELTRALDNFVGECLDDDGNPKAPSKRALNFARGILPSAYKNSIVKKKR